MIKHILIIGIQGSLSRLVAKKILEVNPEIKILGIDSREITSLTPIEGLSIERIRYSRSSFERLFRTHTFDAIIHLGRLSHSTLADRISVNLVGTSTILELASRFQTKKVIILSTHHVYGALADNSMFLTEDSPLRASFKYPELRDVVEMDQMSTNWMWKNQNEISTVVLRPCNIIGPTTKNAFTQYLTTGYTPAPIDYNPILQFIHEEDIAEIIRLSLTEIPTGVYNVAPFDYLSLRTTLLYLKIPRIPCPVSILQGATRFISPIWKFPRYLLDYIKYSTTISSELFEEKLPDFQFKYTAYESLESLKSRID